uniref:FAF domain-containing protein n=1 Tax=Oryza brachyantha TaxID=4533 RepID=J3LXM6_ORYBR
MAPPPPLHVPFCYKTPVEPWPGPRPATHSRPPPHLRPSSGGLDLLTEALAESFDPDDVATAAATMDDNVAVVDALAPPCKRSHVLLTEGGGGGPPPQAHPHPARRGGGGGPPPPPSVRRTCDLLHGGARASATATLSSMVAAAGGHVAGGGARPPPEEDVSQHGVMLLRRTRTGRAAFPPPISVIGKGGRPWLTLRAHREDGRLVLREMRLPSQELLQPCKEDGRFKLFIHPEAGRCGGAGAGAHVGLGREGRHSALES